MAVRKNVKEAVHWACTAPTRIHTDSLFVLCSGRRIANASSRGMVCSQSCRSFGIPGGLRRSRLAAALSEGACPQEATSREVVVVNQCLALIAWMPPKPRHMLLCVRSIANDHTQQWQPPRALRSAQILHPVRRRSGVTSVADRPHILS
jgi:hypothetical protein